MASSRRHFGVFVNVNAGNLRDYITVHVMFHSRGKQGSIDIFGMYDDDVQFAFVAHLVQFSGEINVPF
jgi:hypothetical protein